MDIGMKMKKARINAGLTQEQVAESLGVSRQTISNWENDKTYPDIISVIKISDLYNVSLDHLLKERSESSMSNYMEYLEESTNIVKSKEKLMKVILIATYLGIWAIAIIFFWFFTTPSDAMGYALLYLWFLLPIITFIISALIGLNNCWGRYKWFFTILLGIMYMLAEFATFGTSKMISTHRFDNLEFGMMLGGVVHSAVGMGIGSIIRYIIMMIKRKK